MKTSRRSFLMQSGMAAAAMMLRSSARVSDPTDLRDRLAHDPLRPQYHLMPAANWMNDPNGPIFFKGRYHMFFQYNPNASVWGNMHWAHSSSPDMIHWKHEPVGCVGPRTFRQPHYRGHRAHLYRTAGAALHLDLGYVVSPLVRPLADSANFQRPADKLRQNRGRRGISSRYLD